MSPLQYQKQIRLQQARLRLLANPADVAGTGHAVGYTSASQFSREYRRLFGAPPGRDAAQLQNASRTPTDWRGCEAVSLRAFQERRRSRRKQYPARARARAR